MLTLQWAQLNIQSFQLRLSNVQITAHNTFRAKSTNVELLVTLCILSYIRFRALEVQKKEEDDEKNLNFNPKFLSLTAISSSVIMEDFNLTGQQKTELKAERFSGNCEWFPLLRVGLQRDVSDSSSPQQTMAQSEQNDSDVCHKRIKNGSQFCF